MPTAIAVRVIFWLWFFGAVIAGQQLVLQRVPPFGVPAIVGGLTALLLVAYFAIAAFRAWVDALDLRAIVLLHLTRFVGIYFLWLYQRGQLPHDFAVPGGVGDIIVATFALPVALAPMAPALRHRATMIWNTVGLADILLVVATAARLNLANPLQMRALTRLPLSLLPTLLVPLIVASHVVVYVRPTRTQPVA